MTGRVGIQQTLFRMESNIQAIRQDIAYMREAQMTRANEVERRFNDHETRLRIVEAKRYLEAKSITTVAAIVLPILAIAVSIIAIVVK